MIIQSLLYIAALGLLNHIRGGYLQKFYHNTMLYKIGAGVFVGIATYLLTWAAIQSAVVGLTWYLFMLLPWGAWFDIGTSEPLYNRGWIYTPIYKSLANRLSQQATDLIMMFIRGLHSIIIWAPLAYLHGNLWILSLTIPTAAFWTAGYYLDRVIIRKNYSEYIAGAVVGFFLVLALLLM